MPITPAKILPCTIDSITSFAQWTIDDGTNDPYLGVDYQWQVALTITPQPHSSHLTPNYQSYDGTDVSVGDWMADVSSGKAVKIVSITSQNAVNVTCVVEDVDRYNTFTDTAQSGYGIGSVGNAFIFQLAEDGLPILTPLSYVGTVVRANAAYLIDLLSRFRHRNTLTSFYRVEQAAHGLNVGQIIYLKSDGTYARAIAGVTVQHVVGAVTSIGVPGPNFFTYRPVGKVIQNINPALPGSPGGLVYISADGSFTATKPNAWAKPVYIRLETGDKGIFLDRSVDTVGAQGYTSQVYVVPDMNARDALSVNIGDQAYVLDDGDGEWGHYLYSGGLWTLIVNEEASATDSETATVTLDYTATGPLLISEINPGRRVGMIIVSVTEEFDGTTPSTLTVGDDDAQTRLMDASQNDLSVVGDYTSNPTYTYPIGGEDIEIKVYPDFAADATQGEVRVTITYS